MSHVATTLDRIEAKHREAKGDLAKKTPKHEEHDIVLTPEEHKKRSNVPHLLRLTDDPISEVLAYYVDQSKTRVCAKDVAGETEASLQFTGLGMAKDHAFFEYNGTALTLTLVGSARGFVNGEAAGSAAVTLNHNDCILLGAYNFFRVVHPKQSAGFAPELPGVNRCNYVYALQQLSRAESKEFASRDPALARAVHGVRLAKELLAVVGVPRVSFTVTQQAVRSTAGAGDKTVFAVRGTDSEKPSLLSVETVDEFLDRVERMQIEHDAFVAAGGGKFEVKEGSPFLLFDAKPRLLGIANIPLNLFFAAGDNDSGASHHDASLVLNGPVRTGKLFWELDAKLAAGEAKIDVTDKPASEKPATTPPGALRKQLGRKLLVSVSIKHVESLPVGQCARVTGSFKFAGQECSLNAVDAAASTTAVFDFKRSFELAITEEFLVWLSTSGPNSSTAVIEVELQSSMSDKHKVKTKAQAPKAEVKSGQAGQAGTRIQAAWRGFKVRRDKAREVALAKCAETLGLISLQLSGRAVPASDRSRLVQGVATPEEVVDLATDLQREVRRLLDALKTSNAKVAELEAKLAEKR